MAQIKVWSVTTRELTRVLEYHYHDVACMAFSRDDRLLVSAGNYLDNTVVRQEMIRSFMC